MAKLTNKFRLTLVLLILILSGIRWIRLCVKILLSCHIWWMSKLTIWIIASSWFVYKMTNIRGSSSIVLTASASTPSSTTSSSISSSITSTVRSIYRILWLEANSWLILSSPKIGRSKTILLHNLKY